MTLISLDTAYPETAAQRSRWVTARRGPKNRLDPWKPYAFLWEEEAGAAGELIPTATVFLTNRECPYRCLMCDLWQNTLDVRPPIGAVPAQIGYALERLPPARQIKLYNAGSFFDAQAFPMEDDPAIAEIVQNFERVIVECHPALIGDRCLRFQDQISGKLEVAIGLETVHPEVLDRLNKRFTVADFRSAAVLLAQHDIAMRVFLLLRPPFLSEHAGIIWAKRSLDVAFENGATACCIIPTRGGNGAMETLAAQGHFTPPSLRSLEAVQDYGLNLGQGRVFSDLWDIEKFYTCACGPSRTDRLTQMNQTQQIPPPVICDQCVL